MSVGAFKPVSAGGPPSRPTVSVRSCGLLVLRPLSLARPVLVVLSFWFGGHFFPDSWRSAFES